MGGGFGQRTIWVSTEEIPVASAMCPATHMCTENDQPGPAAVRLLYKYSTLFYGVTRVCRFSPSQSCHLPSPRFARLPGYSPCLP